MQRETAPARMVTPRGRAAAAARGGLDLALTGSEEAPRPSLLGFWPQLGARIRGAEHLLVQRLAGTVFLIRVLTAALAIAALAAGGVRLFAARLDDHMVIPLYLACITMPAYELAKVQEGISRSYDWVGLAMMPAYVCRQLLLALLMAAAYFAHFPTDATTAMIVAGVSIWLPTFAQLVLVNRRLKARIERGPRTYAFGRWLTTALPILMAEGFYSLLTYTDVLVLQYFRSPDEVALYYGAAKTLALVSFIYYSISATIAHRFSGYHAVGDRAGLSALIAQSIKWTFWPSLAATALLLAFGRPILSLFGPQFTDG